MKTYGRTTLLANYTEQEILDAEKNQNKLDEIIINILNNSLPLHKKNRIETLYLKAYYNGDQDIKYKEKHTREEINNIIVENWAYACVDFKKTFLLGKPIQYVSLDDGENEEISQLNKYLKYEDKKAKDMEAYEDVLVCGRAFRYTNKDQKNPPDEAPFEIINCPVEDTEVVYSSSMRREQLLSYIVTDMEELIPSENEKGVVIYNKHNYMEITVYLRNMQLVYSDKSGEFKRVGEPIPILYNEHVINEYYVNRKRISLIEIGKDLFNQINNIESLNADDLEQFVNAILVFINAQVSGKELDQVKELGAVSINSDENKKASVELLQGTPNSANTQIDYTRVLNALHQILGIPVSSEYGVESTGDTGKAKLTGQGYTSAGIRIEGDETMFARCDFNSLRVILNVCKNTPNSNIKKLKISEIDSKFQRDMSDNLLVKTQGLLNLYNADIPREFANSIVNLFSDPHAVTQMQEKLFGKQVSQLQGKQNNSNFENGNSDFTKDVDKANEQNKTANNAEQMNLQGQ